MKQLKSQKAYKAFNYNWTCRDFKYEVGKTYEINEEPIICKKGFHACYELKDCLMYYPLNKDTIFAEVEILGHIDTDTETYLNVNDSKVCTNKIKIVREITWEEILELLTDENNNCGYNNKGHNNIGTYNIGNNNIGDFNTGNNNIGNDNRGNNNKGNLNKGNNNIGDDNIGNCNDGDDNYGYFNVGHCKHGMFNNEIRRYKYSLYYAFNKEIGIDIFAILKSKIACFDILDIDFIQKNKEFIKYAKSINYFDSEIFAEITGYKI